MHAAESRKKNRIPFTLAAEQDQPKMNLQRILEAVIIAAIIGGITMYASVGVISNDIKNLRNDMQRIEDSVNGIRKDFYKPVNNKNP